MFRNTCSRVEYESRILYEVYLINMTTNFFSKVFCICVKNYILEKYKLKYQTFLDIFLV